MITPLRSVGAGGDQENVMFLAVRWVTVKLLWGTTRSCIIMHESIAQNMCSIKLHHPVNLHFISALQAQD